MAAGIEHDVEAFMGNPRELARSDERRLRLGVGFEPARGGGLGVGLGAPRIDRRLAALGRGQLNLAPASLKT